jgi:hypothetical protein
LVEKYTIRIAKKVMVTQYSKRTIFVSVHPWYI